MNIEGEKTKSMNRRVTDQIMSKGFPASAKIKKYCDKH